MVEDVFQRIHEEQMEKLENSTTVPSNTPLQQERELDGKMDKKTFLQYVKGLEKLLLVFQEPCL